MPTLSMFFGIIIRMYADDHTPPHFHAFYQGDNATFDMNGNLLEGEMPTKQQKLIAAWAEIHHDELVANWELAVNKEALFKISPLKQVSCMGQPCWVVVEVIPCSDYTLKLSFADGKKGVFNFTPLLEDNYYAPLSQLSLFMSARAEYGTVVWDDDRDVAPELLYEGCCQVLKISKQHKSIVLV